MGDGKDFLIELKWIVPDIRHCVRSQRLQLEDRYMLFSQFGNWLEILLEALVHAATTDPCR